MSSKFKPKYKRVAQLKTAEDLEAYLQELGINLGFDKDVIVGANSPFREPYQLRSGKKPGNRFCILPMEGWDGTASGQPTEFTTNRWKNFGKSGAKLIWGGEAVAVNEQGKANPRQLVMNENNVESISELRETLIDEHRVHHGSADDLCIGLQLTHSGRFCKPFKQNEPIPKILYHHPVLDAKFGLAPDYPLLKDNEIDQIIADYVQGAKLANEAGFDFVDIKHCHGYLGHEFLTAYHRKGKYGGSFENRTRFLREIITGIQFEVPEIEIGVRVSVFDFIPFIKDKDGTGIPYDNKGQPYEFAFGGDKTGIGIDTNEIFSFLSLLETLGIELVCVTAGSPYYTPHVIRPALFPPSDGYQPPEDPLAGVARQIAITAQIKQQFPNLAIVGSAYSYLQEWLPNVAQNVLSNNMADFIGMGRMVLSYPELPMDILNGNAMRRNKICRTFSDCTTAPRNGLISGCYPLDPVYKQLEEAEKLKALKN